jgi:hypothetical protein
MPCGFLLPGDVLPIDPQRQEVLRLQRPTLKLLEGLFGPLLKAAAHRRLAQPKAVNELACHPLVVALRQPEQDRLGQLLAHVCLLHRLVALQGALLAGLRVPNARYMRRKSCGWDAFPVDPNRSGVGAPPTVPAVVGLVTRVPFTRQRLDLVLQNLPGQEAGHLSMVSKKLELHVDWLVEQVSNGLRNWCLVGAWAMLGHLEKGSCLSDALVKDHRRRTPSLFCFSTEPEYTPIVPVIS